MADTKATVAIVGQNLSGPAFRSAVNDANTAAKRMAGAFKFAFAGIAGLSIGAAVRGIFKEMDTAQKATAQLNAALKSTGGIVGLTKAELEGFAAGLQRTTTFSDDAVKAMQAVLLSFTNIRGPQFRAANTAILDLATRLGIDLPSAARTVGKALNDAGNSFGVLKKAGIDFSAAEENVIKALVRTGDVAAAQDKILAALTQRFGGAAEAARNTLGGAIEGLTNAFGELFEGTEEGLKQTTDAINSLADTLEDPELKAAFQESEGRLLSYGAAWIEFGLKVTKGSLAAGNALLRWKDTVLEATREQLNRFQVGGQGLGDFANVGGILGDAGETSFGGARPVKPRDRGGREAAGLSADLLDDLEEFKVSVAKIKTLTNANDDFLKQMEEATRTSVQKQAVAWEDYVLEVKTLLATGAIDAEEASKRIAARFDEELPEIVVGAHKISADLKNVFDDISVYADQAARNIQDSFADFLFDPFEGGLRGMLQGFTNVIRRMLAEMAAAKIFGAVGSGGFSDFLSSLFAGFGRAAGAGAGGGGGGSRVPGLAAGGSFMVGGRPGVDQNLVAFGATRGERVTVTPAGHTSGQKMELNIYNDNRGATSEFIKFLPEHDRRLADQIEARIVTRLKRQQYNLQQ